MKNFKPHTFAFSLELDELFQKIAKKTELKLITIVKKGIEAYAREIGIKEGKEDV